MADSGEPARPHKNLVPRSLRALWDTHPLVVVSGVVVAVLGAALSLCWPLTDVIAAHDVGLTTGSLRASSLQTAREAVRTQLLTLGAGVFAAGALWFTARNFILSRRTFELTEQGQVTDRYTKAIEQLGSDKLDVRIGAIYALERVARDSARDHPIVMEVLAAFIREHSHEQWPQQKPGTDPPKRQSRPDVQAAVTVIGRRNANRDLRQINLARADLTAADLTGAHLQGVGLTGAHLNDADLTHAQLTGADLHDADLIGANLRDADLTGANLEGAHVNDLHYFNPHLTRVRLVGANLQGAHLEGARLGNANLAGAYLNRAYLKHAHLRDADLTGAYLFGTDLTGADLTGADLTGAHLNDSLLTTTHVIRSSATGVHVDLTGTDLTSADLTRTRWPENTAVPEGWVRDPGSDRLKRVE